MKKEIVSIRISEEDKAQLAKQAKELGLSMSSYIVMLIKKEGKKMKKQLKVEVYSGSYFAFSEKFDTLEEALEQIKIWIDDDYDNIDLQDNWGEDEESLYQIIYEYEDGEIDDSMTIDDAEIRERLGIEYTYEDMKEIRFKNVMQEEVEKAFAKHEKEQGIRIEKKEKDNFIKSASERVNIRKDGNYTEAAREEYQEWIKNEIERKWGE